MKAFTGLRILFFFSSSCEKKKGEGRESKYFFFFKARVRFVVKDKDYLYLTIFESRKIME